MFEGNWTFDCDASLVLVWLVSCDALFLTKIWNPFSNSKHHQTARHHSLSNIVVGLHINNNITSREKKNRFSNLGHFHKSFKKFFLVAKSLRGPDAQEAGDDGPRDHWGEWSSGVRAPPDRGRLPPHCIQEWGRVTGRESHGRGRSRLCWFGPKHKVQDCGSENYLKRE